MQIFDKHVDGTRKPRGFWTDIAKKAEKGTQFMLPYAKVHTYWTEHPLKGACYRLGIPVSTQKLNETHFVLTFKGKYYEKSAS